MLRRALLSAAIAALAAGPAYAGSDAPRLHATAGLGGIGKAGRWTPVRVLVEAADEDLTGQLVVEWGGARVRREIALAAPSRKTFDIYIQSGDVRDEITVRLFVGGRERRTVAAPIRVASIDEPITVCVDGGTNGDEAVDCSTTLAADDLPRSWRGYDAADSVVWLGDRRSDLDEDQRGALDLWRAVRRSEIDSPRPAGALPATIWPPSPLARDVAWYVVVLGLVAAGLRASRARASLTYSAIAALATVGSLAASASGSHAPLALHYVGTVEQFAGAADGIATVRAAVESPSAGRMVLHTAGVDGAIEVSPSSDSSLGAGLDVDGNAAIAGRIGRGSSAVFTLEASGRLGPFAIAARGGTVQVTNVSGRPLYGCEFPPGFPQDVRELEPGRSVESRQGIEENDPVVTCRTAAPPVVFVEPNHPVGMDGETIAVVHLKTQAVQ